jgi:hypothetical protein
MADTPVCHVIVTETPLKVKVALEQAMNAQKEVEV